jgi:hypothetical protein
MRLFGQALSPNSSYEGAREMLRAIVKYSHDLIDEDEREEVAVCFAKSWSMHAPRSVIPI